MKFLLWLGIVIVVIWAFRTNKKQQRSAPSSPQHAPGSKAEHKGAESMVCCAHCGVYIPASEAISHAGALYCSAQHRNHHLSS